MQTTLTIGAIVALTCIFTVWWSRICQANEDHIAIMTIAYEASGEPIEGQVLVASVIKQRMLDRGMRISDVVMQPKQFSCWNPGAKMKERTPEELETAKMAWHLSVPQGYNHYCRIDCYPSWREFMKDQKIVGNHVFGRL